MMVNMVKGYNPLTDAIEKLQFNDRPTMHTVLWHIFNILSEAKKLLDDDFTKGLANG